MSNLLEVGIILAAGMVAATILGGVAMSAKFTSTSHYGDDPMIEAARRTLPSWLFFRPDTSLEADKMAAEIARLEKAAQTIANVQWRESYLAALDIPRYLLREGRAKIEKNRKVDEAQARMPRLPR